VKISATSTFCEIVSKIRLAKNDKVFHSGKPVFWPRIRKHYPFDHDIFIIIIYFPSVDPYRITKSKWIWKSSHFRENKEYNHYKVYINNKAQYNI